MADTSFFARAHFAQIRGANGVPHFRSSILRLDGSTFTVAPPPPIMSVAAGQAVSVVVPTAEGIYQFETTIRGMRSTAPRGVDLNLPDRVEHTQRREFARSPIQVEALLNYEFPPGSAHGSQVIARLTTRDLSAGGLRAIVETVSPPYVPQPDLDGQIEFRIAPSAPPCRCRCRVLRVAKDGGPGRLMIAAEFFGLANAERDRISRTVLAHQAEQRRNGRL